MLTSGVKHFNGGGMLANGLQIAAQTGSSDEPPKGTLCRNCRDAQAYRWMHRRGQRNTVSGMPTCNAHGCGCSLWLSCVCVYMCACVCLCVYECACTSAECE
jgi:hypothetical protein